MVIPAVGIHCVSAVQEEGGKSFSLRGGREVQGAQPQGLHTHRVQLWVGSAPLGSEEQVWVSWLGGGVLGAGGEGLG